MPSASTSNGLIARAHLLLLRLSVVYLVVLCLLTIPLVQRHAVYVHKVKWPLFADFDKPQKYGLPVHRTLNVKIPTPDGVLMGAWLLMPELETRKRDDEHTHDLLPAHPPTPAQVNASLATHPTIIFLHGNAATRAVPARVRYLTTYARAFRANVLAIDYRGFADSSGSPSRAGLVLDARTALKWVQDRGARAEDVLLVGLSLGTGVTAAVAAELADEGVQIRGVVLLAPFTSIKSLLRDYRLFGLMPVLQPLQPFPWLSTLVSGFFRDHFDTEAIIHNIRAPILLAHSKNDYDIPSSHSQRLFDSLVEPHLPELPVSPLELMNVDWKAYRAAANYRNTRREALIHTQSIANCVNISHFRVFRDELAGEDAVFMETLWGGHNLIGLQESVVDLIGAFFRLA